MKWNVMNAVGEYLGVIHAESAEQALAFAIKTMPDASYVEPRDVFSDH